MRTFIGIDLPFQIKHKIANFKEENLKKLKNIKEVEDSNLHITIKFLGEMAEDKVQNIVKRISGISFRSFEIKIKGVGVFPNIYSARVIWIGAESSEIFKIKTEIDETLEELGVEKDYNFIPHITIARLKSRENPKIIEQIISKGEDFGSFRIREITLFQSILTPQGPIYRKIANTYSLDSSDL